MRISDWSSDVCSSDLLDNHGIRIPAARITRIGEELIAGDLGIEIAEGQIDKTVRVRPDDRLQFDTPDIGVNRVIHRRSCHDAAELQSSIFVVKCGGIQLQRAVCEDVLGANFERSEEHTSELQSLLRIS